MRTRDPVVKCTLQSPGFSTDPGEDRDSARPCAPHNKHPQLSKNSTPLFTSPACKSLTFPVGLPCCVRELKTPAVCGVRRSSEVVNLYSADLPNNVNWLRCYFHPSTKAPWVCTWVIRLLSPLFKIAANASQRNSDIHVNYYLSLTSLPHLSSAALTSRCRCVDGFRQLNGQAKWPVVEAQFKIQPK